MPGEVAGSIRELAAAVGRSHTAVSGWIRHPRWDQSPTPPWDVERARDWAARMLAANPAEQSGPRVAAGHGGGGSSERPGTSAASHGGPAAVHGGAAPGGGLPADPGIEALRRNPLAAAKLKLTVVRAQKLELERAILAGEFVPRRDVEQLFASCAYRVRSALEALPRQLAERLARLNDAAAIEAVLDDAIRAALLELSRGPDLPPPPETGGAGESNPT
ncbi:MAG: hypothetical protein U1D55_00260 [Phycisphaerae bacterium]